MREPRSWWPMSVPERQAPIPGAEAPPRRFVSWLDRWGVPACFLWGLAEATLFFVVPDVIVGLVSLYRPRKLVKAATAAIAGALLGGLVLYVVTRAIGSGMRDVVDAVPFVPHRMLAQAQHDLTVHGGAATVIAPFARIPYKVYAVEMSLRAWSPWSLLLWTIPARAVRIVPAALLAGGVGWLVRRRLRRRPRVGLALYAVLWIAVYANYWRSTGF
jgi:membrane protein YqaA with SNARE-associated domain